jgi:hypothetical protein
MFLAHYSGGGIVPLLEMDGEELNFWYNEAVKLHKKMNPSDG